MKECTIEGTRYILFDEVQYTENWELWMKVIYDSRKDIRLIATGSASPILERGLQTAAQGVWSVSQNTYYVFLMSIAGCLVSIYLFWRMSCVYQSFKALVRHSLAV